MTRSEVVSKLIGRLVIKNDIEVFLDCQENNGIKSIAYKDVNQYSYFGVSGDSWEEIYLQIRDNLKNEGYIK